MNRKGYSKQVKKRNNRIAYTIRKRQEGIGVRDNTQPFISNIYGFGYKPTELMGQIKRIKLNVSFSKLKKIFKDINIFDFESIGEFSKKRDGLEKEIKILRRDWNINNIIDEK